MSAQDARCLSPRQEKDDSKTVNDTVIRQVMSKSRNLDSAGLLLEEVRVDSLDLVRLLDVDAEVELDHEFR